MAVALKLSLLDADLEADMRHAEWDESVLHLLFYLLGSLCAELGNGLCQVFATGFQLGCLLLLLCQCLVTVLNVRELGLEIITLGDKLFDALGMVFLQEVIESVKTVIDGLKLCRVEIYMLHLTADLSCDIL